MAPVSGGKAREAAQAIERQERQSRREMTFRPQRRSIARSRSRKRPTPKDESDGNTSAGESEGGDEAAERGVVATNSAERRVTDGKTAEGGVAETDSAERRVTDGKAAELAQWRREMAARVGAGDPQLRGDGQTGAGRGGEAEGIELGPPLPAPRSKVKAPPRPSTVKIIEHRQPPIPLTTDPVNGRSMVEGTDEGRMSPHRDGETTVIAQRWDRLPRPPPAQEGKKEGTGRGNQPTQRNGGESSSAVHGMWSDGTPRYQPPTQRGPSPNLSPIPHPLSNQGSSPHSSSPHPELTSSPFSESDHSVPVTQRAWQSANSLVSRPLREQYIQPRKHRQLAQWRTLQSGQAPLQFPSTPVHPRLRQPSTVGSTPQASPGMKRYDSPLGGTQRTPAVHFRDVQNDPWVTANSEVYNGPGPPLLTSDRSQGIEDDETAQNGEQGLPSQPTNYQPSNPYAPPPFPYLWPGTDGVGTEELSWRKKKAEGSNGATAPGRRRQQTPHSLTHPQPEPQVPGWLRYPEEHEWRSSIQTMWNDQIALEQKHRSEMAEMKSQMADLRVQVEEKREPSERRGLGSVRLDPVTGLPYPAPQRQSRPGQGLGSARREESRPAAPVSGQGQSLALTQLREQVHAFVDELEKSQEGGRERSGRQEGGDDVGGAQPSRDSGAAGQRSLSPQSRGRHEQGGAGSGEEPAWQTVRRGYGPRPPSPPRTHQSGQGAFRDFRPDLSTQSYPQTGNAMHGVKNASFALKQIPMSERFSGTGDQSASSFFADFENACEMSGLEDDKLKAQMLRGRFCGTAQLHYVGLSSSQQLSYSAVKASLLSFLNSPDFVSYRLQGMQSYQMKPKETYRDFGNRILIETQSLFSECSPEKINNLAVSYFIQSLPPGPIRQRLVGEKRTSMMDTVLSAELEERRRSEASGGMQDTRGGATVAMADVGQPPVGKAIHFNPYTTVYEVETFQPGSTERREEGRSGQTDSSDGPQPSRGRRRQGGPSHSSLALQPNTTSTPHIPRTRETEPVRNEGEYAFYDRRRTTNWRNTRGSPSPSRSNSGDRNRETRPSRRCFRCDSDSHLYAGCPERDRSRERDRERWEKETAMGRESAAQREAKKLAREGARQSSEERGISPRRSSLNSQAPSTYLATLSPQQRELEGRIGRARGSSVVNAQPNPALSNLASFSFSVHAISILQPAPYTYVMRSGSATDIQGNALQRCFCRACLADKEQRNCRTCLSLAMGRRKDQLGIDCPLHEDPSQELQHQTMLPQPGKAPHCPSCESQLRVLHLYGSSTHCPMCHREWCASCVMEEGQETELVEEQPDPATSEQSYESPQPSPEKTADCESSPSADGASPTRHESPQPSYRDPTPPKSAASRATSLDTPPLSNLDSTADHPALSRESAQPSRVSVWSSGVGTLKRAREHTSDSQSSIGPSQMKNTRCPSPCPFPIRSSHLFSTASDSSDGEDEDEREAREERERRWAKSGARPKSDNKYIYEGKTDDLGEVIVHSRQPTPTPPTGKEFKLRSAATAPPPAPTKTPSSSSAPPHRTKSPASAGPPTSAQPKPGPTDSAALPSPRRIPSKRAGGYEEGATMRSPTPSAAQPTFFLRSGYDPSLEDTGKHLLITPRDFEHLGWASAEHYYPIKGPLFPSAIAHLIRKLSIKGMKIASLTVVGERLLPYRWDPNTGFSSAQAWSQLFGFTLNQQNNYKVAYIAPPPPNFNKDPADHDNFAAFHSRIVQGQRAASSTGKPCVVIVDALDWLDRPWTPWLLPSSPQPSASGLYYFASCITAQLPQLGSFTLSPRVVALSREHGGTVTEFLQLDEGRPWSRPTFSASTVLNTHSLCCRLNLANNRRRDRNRREELSQREAEVCSREEAVRIRETALPNPGPAQVADAHQPSPAATVSTQPCPGSMASVDPSPAPVASSLPGSGHLSQPSRYPTSAASPLPTEQPHPKNQPSTDSAKDESLPFIIESQRRSVEFEFKEETEPGGGSGQAQRQESSPAASSSSSATASSATPSSAESTPLPVLQPVGVRPQSHPNRSSCYGRCEELQLQGAGGASLTWNPSSSPQLYPQTSVVRPMEGDEGTWKDREWLQAAYPGVSQLENLLQMSYGAVSGLYPPQPSPRVAPAQVPPGIQQLMLAAQLPHPSPPSPASQPQQPVMAPAPVPPGIQQLMLAAQLPHSSPPSPAPQPQQPVISPVRTISSERKNRSRKNGLQELAQQILRAMGLWWGAGMLPGAQGLGDGDVLWWEELLVASAIGAIFVLLLVYVIFFIGTHYSTCWTRWTRIKERVGVMWKLIKGLPVEMIVLLIDHVPLMGPRCSAKRDLPQIEEGRKNGISGDRWAGRGGREEEERGALAEFDAATGAARLTMPQTSPEPPANEIQRQGAAGMPMLYPMSWRRNGDLRRPLALQASFGESNLSLQSLGIVSSGVGTDPRPYIPVVINQASGNLLVDTGSMITIVTDTFLLRMTPIPPRVYGPCPQILGLGGSQMPLAIIKVEIKVQGMTVGLPVMVLKEGQVPGDGILGMDALRSPTLSCIHWNFSGRVPPHTAAMATVHSPSSSSLLSPQPYDAAEMQTGSQGGALMGPGQEQTVYFQETTTGLRPLCGPDSPQLVVRDGVLVPPGGASLVQVCFVGLSVSTVIAEPSPKQEGYCFPVSIVPLNENRQGALYIFNSSQTPLALDPNQPVGMAEDASRFRISAVDWKGQDQGGTGEGSWLERNGDSGCEVSGKEWAMGMRVNQAEVASIRDPTLPQHTDDMSISHVPQPHQDSLRLLLRKYANVWSKNKQDVGKLDILQHHIDIGDAGPQASRPSRLSHFEQKVLRHHVESWLKKGYVEPAPDSPFSAPVVIVRKQDCEDPTNVDSYRIALSYKKINAVTRNNAQWPIVPIRESLGELRGKSVLCGLDIVSAYHMLSLTEESRPLTAFSAFDQSLQWIRAPMGLSGLPATFAAALSLCLQGLEGRICRTYVDDCCVWGNSYEETLSNLEAVLCRFLETGVKLSKSKAQLMVPEISWLGFRVSGTGHYPDPKRTKALLSAPSPRTLAELRTFVYSMQYWSRHIPKFHHVAGPLYSLLQLPRLVWQPEHETAFQLLKSTLARCVSLHFPDHTKLFILSSDASFSAVGCCVSQRDEQGVEYPLSFTAHRFNETQLKYSIVEKEAFGIMFGLESNRVWLHNTSQSILCRSDHSAHTAFMSSSCTNPRLSRWREKLRSEFRFHVEYVKGKSAEAQTPDFLSRLGQPLKPAKTFQEYLLRKPGQSATCLPIQLRSGKEVGGDGKGSQDGVQLRRGQLTTPTPAITQPSPLCDVPTSEWPSITMAIQREDGKLGRIIEGLQGEGEEKRRWCLQGFELKNGILYRQRHLHKVLVCPGNMQGVFIRLAHEGLFGGHQGPSKTLGLLERKVYFPGMAAAVQMWCEGCAICAGLKDPWRTVVPPLSKHSADYLQPFSALAIDIAGAYPVTKRGNTVCLIVVCLATKYPLCFPLPDQKAATIVEAMCEGVFAIFGVCKVISSDLGSCFVSSLFQEFGRVFGFTQELHGEGAQGFRQAGNGQAEVGVKNFIRFQRAKCATSTQIRTMLGDHQLTLGEFDAFVQTSLMPYRASSHPYHGMSPYELVFGGRLMMLPLDLVLSSRMGYEEDPTPVQWASEKLARAEESIRRQIVASSQSECDQHDKMVYLPKRMVVGALVRKKKEGQRGDKFSPVSWDGPYKIISFPTPQHALLQHVFDVDQPRMKCHLSKLKVSRELTPRPFRSEGLIHRPPQTAPAATDPARPGPKGASTFPTTRRSIRLAEERMKVNEEYYRTYGRLRAKPPGSGTPEDQSSG